MPYLSAAPADPGGIGWQRSLACLAAAYFGLATGCGLAFAQTPPASTAKVQANAPAPAASAQKAASSKSRNLVLKSEWADLTPAQQVALHPLAPTWSRISEGQKRKWIALSRNFPTLSTSERTILHGRMTEWAALSGEQRSQARLNFAETKRLSSEEKKAQWEAYQALSPEQRKQFAAGARPKLAGAAPAVTPLAPNKLAAVPVTRSDAAIGQSSPARPPLVHTETLVPAAANHGNAAPATAQ